MKRRNKHGNERTPCNQCHIHGSKYEAGYCNTLALRMRAGEFKEYFSQYDFELYAYNPLRLDTRISIGKHVVDFYIPELNEVHETKGHPTAEWKLKRKIFEANYPGIKYIVVTKNKKIKATAGG